MNTVDSMILNKDLEALNNVLVQIDSVLAPCHNLLLLDMEQIGRIKKEINSVLIKGFLSLEIDGIVMKFEREINELTSKELLSKEKGMSYLYNHVAFNKQKEALARIEELTKEAYLKLASQ